MNYAILRIRKIHTQPALQAAQKHNKREFPLPNANAALKALNQSLVDAPSFTQRWQEVVAEEEALQGHPIKVRKNAVIAVELVSSFSRDSVPQSRVNDWALANLAWVQNKYGPEHVISCELHMDEETPHLHTVIVPIDQRGHLCAKSLFNGRQGLKALQTDYGKAMEQFGLSRGERFSKAKKEDLRSFYKAVNNAVSLPDRLPGEEDAQYADRLASSLKEARLLLVKEKRAKERAFSDSKTKEAQVFSRFSHPISLYEDLNQKFGGDVERVVERIRLYRRLEKAKEEDLFPILKKAEEALGVRDAPLFNWAKETKKARPLYEEDGELPMPPLDSGGTEIG